LRKSVSKTVRLPKELLEVVRHRARQEKIDESTAIRQLLALGAENYAVELFRHGRITLSEAAGLAGVTVRQMIDVLQTHGIRGNVRLDQQQKALEFVKEL
jgi:predicted HTH domain antitoxin